MADFINTIDVLGDDAVVDSIIDKSITEFKDNRVTKVGENTFRSCLSLSDVDLPKVTTVDKAAFCRCSSLKNVNLPLVTSIVNDTFWGVAVETIRLPSVVSISSYAFYDAQLLRTLILDSETLCILGRADALFNTPFAQKGTGGVLLVPSALVTAYTEATNWSVIYGYGTNRFLALEDYTVDGTTTGAIDWDKVNALF